MAGIYLHVPFCTRKCPYCDFFSRVGDERQLADYVVLLQRALAWHAARWEGPCETLFFGGGTPSLLSPAQVATLLTTVQRLYRLPPGAERTLEANPGTVDEERLAGYRQAGINRLSLGVQSLDDRMLAALGRTHTAAQAREAFTAARRAGFDNLSCDLIFALPGQQLSDLDRELDALLELGPEHLSSYALTLEKGTPLHRRHLRQPLSLPEDEEVAELYLHLHRRLSAAGYHHYEISNFARQGAECRHNLATWQRRPYLGVGAGAHSFQAVGWGERWAVPADLARFARVLAAGRDPRRRLETFGREAAMRETLYLGLRCAAGVAEEDFRERFGIGVAEAFPDAVRRCRPHLQERAGRWRIDVDGWLIYNHLIGHFYAEK